MGCESCSNGKNGIPRGCRSNGTCASGGCDKLAVYDWLGNMELPGLMKAFDQAEVRFKGTHKDFYRIGNDLQLSIGDAVVVEATIGYDIGIISATGELARMQFDRKKGNSRNAREVRKILRKANSDELGKWREARSKENETMHRAREIASTLSLDMKISDVEYQADASKATFYYTAEGRIDFRELIRKLAEAFRIRIEMRQIGARQEAGRIGGIGSCGRELCCSTWLTDFRSVSTSAARYQQLALNTQKLAGQCGKLKCCLNYELDAYLDALKHFPKNHNKIKTKKGNAFLLKTDIFKGLLWYMYQDDTTGSPIPLSCERVTEIIAMNQEGKFPEDLKDYSEVVVVEDVAFTNVVGQDSLTRFDKKKGGGRSRKKGARNKPRAAKSQTGESGSKRAQASDKKGPKGKSSASRRRKNRPGGRGKKGGQSPKKQ